MKYCPKMGEGNFPIQNKIRSIEIVGIKSETDMNLRNFNTNLCFVIESQKISHTTSIKIKTDLEVLKEWNIKIYQ